MMGSTAFSYVKFVVGFNDIDTFKFYDIEFFYDNIVPVGSMICSINNSKIMDFKVKYEALNLRSDNIKLKDALKYLSWYLEPDRYEKENKRYRLKS